MITMVPDHLVEYSNMLRSLRPLLTTRESRAELMAAIFDEFSERNLAELLEDLFHEDRHALLREAIHAHATLGGSANALKMREALVARGWEFEDEVR